ncbi:MAG: hypothetical protein WA847_20870, partial [Terriglobales bacterium]
APGRSEHPPVMKEREILGKTNQNLLDADRHSHGRPLHSSAQRKAMMSVIEILQQLTLRQTANFLTFIDLPSLQS